MKKIRENATILWWAIRLACRISPRVFFFWLIFSVTLAVLPSIALTCNRNVVSILTAYLMDGSGSFVDVVQPLCVLGGVLILNGLSRRINSDYLYMVMYDDFYFGMQEYIMDSVQKVDIKTLMDKEYYEDYRYCEGRCGSLTDVMSQGCLFIMKSVTTISLIAVAFSVSPMIGLVAVVCFAATLIINYRLSMKIVKDIYAYRGADAESKYYAEEMRKPGVAKEMRIYKNQEKLLANWRRAYQVVQEHDEGYDKARIRLSTIVSVCLYLSTFAMLALSVGQVAKGTQTVDVFLMLYLLGESLAEVNKLFSQSLFQTLRGFHALSNQYHFLKRVPMQEERLLDQQRIAEEIERQKQRAEVVFSAKGLRFYYDGKKEVLHGLDFEIRKGETIALVGSNGSGKSTLVKLLIQLYQPDAGKLCFYGKDYDEYPMGSINQQIGMFFQNFYLYHLTMRENVGVGDLKQLKDDVAILAAIEKGGAGSVLAKCEKGLEQILGREILKNGLNLSGGEKQRVAVARTHMSERDVLIFDEPAAALDPIAEMEQFRNIKAKTEGKTSILISHRVGFARMADRIIVLEKGELVEVGTHEELMKKQGVYADLFDQQAQWYQE